MSKWQPQRKLIVPRKELLRPNSRRPIRSERVPWIWRRPEIVPVRGSVAVDTTGSEQTKSTASTSQTYTNLLTIGTGLSNNAAVFAVWAATTVGGVAGATFSATFNGVTCTVIKRYDMGNGVCSLSLFGVIAPASSAHDLVVTTTNSCIGAAIGVSYTGVNQTGGTTTWPNTNVFDNNPSNGTSGTVTITTTNGNYTFCMCALGSTTASGTNVTPGNIFIDTSGVLLTDIGVNAGAAHNASTGTSTVYTGTNGTTDFIVLVGTDIVAAAGLSEQIFYGRQKYNIPTAGPSRGFRAMQAFPVPAAPSQVFKASDFEKVLPIAKNPDEGTPWFLQSQRPVPTSRMLPKTGEDVDKPPPVARNSDEGPQTFFRPSQVPVPTFVAPSTGEDREHIFPIPKNPDEGIPFVRPSQIVVPQRWLPRTGADTERLPPIGLNPDEAKPFFVRSPAAVPQALWWTQWDQPFVPPLPDLPPEPFFRSVTPVVTPTALWWAPYDQPVERSRFVPDQPPFFQPPPSAIVGISGIAWYQPGEDRERIPSPVKPPDDPTVWFLQSQVIVPTTLLPQTGRDIERLLPPVKPPDEGIPWYLITQPLAKIWFYHPTEDVERLPPIGKNPDESFPFWLITQPLPNKWLPRPSEDVERLLAPIKNPDEATPWFLQSQAPVPNFYWFASYDQPRTQPPPPAQDGPGFVRAPQPTVGISGIAWFQPADHYPPVPVKIGDSMYSWTPNVPPIVPPVVGIREHSIVPFTHMGTMMSM